MSKDDKNILGDGLVGGRVDERLGDLGLVHVKVTTESSPENTLKGGNTVSGNDTSYKANIHAGEGPLHIGSAVVVFDILQERGVVVVDRGANLFYAAVGTVKEAASLTQDPAPLGELDLALLQCLVTFVQGRNTLLEALASFGQLINLGGGRRGEGLNIQVEFAERDAGLVHLRMEVACLTVVSEVSDV